MPRIKMEILRVKPAALSKVIEWEMNAMKICQLHDRTDEGVAHASFMMGLLSSLEATDDDETKRQRHRWKSEACSAHGLLDDAIREASEFYF